MKNILLQHLKELGRKEYNNAKKYYFYNKLNSYLQYVIYASLSILASISIIIGKLDNPILLATAIVVFVLVHDFIKYQLNYYFNATLGSIHTLEKTKKLDYNDLIRFL